jgi:ribosomal protein L11 methyltransferase
MQYLEIVITPITDDVAQIMVAYLSEIHYDSFVEEENTLKAYVLESNFNKQILEDNLAQFQLNYSITKMENINWNEEWEKNYDPVIVNDAVAVRASFHQPIAGVTTNIVITPKMSFGTGHHSTTHLMLEQISLMQMNDKAVLDYGCGTGVLGIYAAMQGAASVIANDIEDWCVENTLENAAVNNVNHVQAFLGDLDALPQTSYDVILANINLNILKAQMHKLAAILKPGGHLFCSGILVSDQEELIATAKEVDVIYQNSSNRLNWLMIHFTK